jgi:hypothetical protein
MPFLKGSDDGVYSVYDSSLELSSSSQFLNPQHFGN